MYLVYLYFIQTPFLISKFVCIQSMELEILCLLAFRHNQTITVTKKNTQSALKQLLFCFSVATFDRYYYLNWSSSLTYAVRQLFPC